MIDAKFVILGALLNITGSASYLRDTIRGKTKPNRVSWFLWATAPLIAFSAEVKHGVGLPALMTFMVGFGPLAIFLGSFVNRKSVWKVTSLDITCGVLSVLGTILWAITGSGDAAVLFTILADGLAAVPTIVKAYKEPESENWHVFFFAALSATITLLAIRKWDFVNFGFPLYILTICVAIVTLIKVRLAAHSKIAATTDFAE